MEILVCTLPTIARRDITPYFNRNVAAGLPVMRTWRVSDARGFPSTS
jgi:hypothetical protein